MTPEQKAELERRLEVFAHASDDVETYLHQCGYPVTAGKWVRGAAELLEIVVEP